MWRVHVTALVIDLLGIAYVRWGKPTELPIILKKERRLNSTPYYLIFGITDKNLTIVCCMTFWALVGT